MRVIAALCLTIPLLAAPPLHRRIAAVLSANPGISQAYWGIEARSLRTGVLIYSHHHDHPFVPASNAKLFSTALALHRLGPDFRLRTSVVAAVPPDQAGVILGDVRLVGGGDPSLSARLYPYRHEGEAPTVLAGLEELAAAVAAKGIRIIRGDLLGDDTAYAYQPYPEGWAQDDTVWEYGAPVSALTINDNALTLQIGPGPEAGALARLSFFPTLEPYAVANQIRTVAAGERHIHIDRHPGSTELQLSGTIPAGDLGTTETVAVPDPALYAAHVFADALQRRGITIQGTIGVRHRYVDTVADLRLSTPLPVPSTFGVELAHRDSPPLGQILQVVNKVSQNLHAELALHTVALARRGLGTREAGLEEMRLFLSEVGIPAEQYHFEDGSGLSRLTLASPAAIVQLLRFMAASPHAEVWRGFLPIGATDGSLAKRFVKSVLAPRVLAKTGSLTHVAALSGYADSVRHGPVAFSILVNNYTCSAAEIRKALDAVALLLTQ